MMEHSGQPFTERELFLALRLFMPESDAAEVARAATGPLDEREREAGGARVQGVMFSDDVLVAISLVSEEAAAKVARYLSDDPRFRSAEERDRWEDRRKQMAEWLREQRGDAM